MRAADPVLREVIDAVEASGAESHQRPHPPDHYGALVRSIVGQQLSTKAASAIYLRLTEFFGGRTPTPAELLVADPEQMRAAAGLSRAKVSFLRSLAEHVEQGELELERFDTMAEADIEAELVAVRGIGTWTVHMFLIFQLQRPDVLAWGDLGIRAAVKRWWELDELPSCVQLEALSEPWRPWRTLACRYLWRALDATPA
ncbi:MAG: DNA-3-methyladenine glycosylase family protein [Solirubrobacteraceae bacterium]